MCGVKKLPTIFWLLIIIPEDKSGKGVKRNGIIYAPNATILKKITI